MIKINIIFINIVYFLFLSGCTTPKKLDSIFSDRSPQTVAYSNSGVIEISDASIFSQVIVLSDVHGMFDQVVTLLKASQVIDKDNNWIAGHALLIINGDSIDKGPKSLEVLNLWIKLEKQSGIAGGKFIHVLGNHEAEFLADPLNDKKAAELISEMQDQNIPVSDLTQTQSPRGIFIHSEPVAARVGKWLFCHSGFYPNMTWNDFLEVAKKTVASQNYASDFLLGDNSILEAKDWEKSASTLRPVINRLDTLGLFGIVFGHQPNAFKIKGRSAAKAKGRLIKIDNGMAPEGGSYPGSVLIFTKPSEMNILKYPHIKIVFPDSSSQELIPE
ncbi:MAG: metallophosphoesterase [Bdellovibrio sp.]|nr:metallophosphoesterase [Bdellovibrio sp.]